ncbi:MAG: hypothetical protein P8Z79_02700 [Sedimentisphaerales bacterium]|jgi:hypothetical protein
MTKDPIVEEVRNARAKLFEECGEDMDRLMDRLKEQERQGQARLVSKGAVSKKRDAGAA